MIVKREKHIYTIGYDGINDIILIDLSFPLDHIIQRMELQHNPPPPI